MKTVSTTTHDEKVEQGVDARRTSRKRTPQSQTGVIKSATEEGSDAQRTSRKRMSSTTGVLCLVKTGNASDGRRMSGKQRAQLHW